MRFNFLASRCPEYCALRAKSQRWALVWEVGHGFVWFALLSLPGGVALWWISAKDPEPRKRAWTVVAAILLWAALGIAVKRYAIKKGAAPGASFR